MRCAIVCVWKGKTEKGKCWVLTKSNWRQRGKQLVVGSLHQADELVKMGKQYNSLKCFFPIIEPPKSFQILHANKVTILFTFTACHTMGRLSTHEIFGSSSSKSFKRMLLTLFDVVGHEKENSTNWDAQTSVKKSFNLPITTPRPGRGAQYPVAWSRRRFVQKLKLNLSRLMSLLIKVTIRQEPEGKGELTKT